jgi:serine/threonine protein kinase/WD40 repeat protein
VQVGDLTLVIEIKTGNPAAVSPTPSSMDITIPQRATVKSNASADVTIPQRTPTRPSVAKTSGTNTAVVANDAPLQGKYTLVREIARGGMGQIYFGEDPQLERQVAVKVSSISEDGEDARFSKEAKVLAQLAHPNIVPIYNIGVDTQRRPFYSMKLIKGRTLQAVLNLIRDGDAAAIKEYPRATLLTIFRKVCDAMMFAHSKGILHRDLKPENIMVGEYGEVLVMDWGLAKILGECEEQDSTGSRVNDTGDYGMTMEGEVMGTPQYMSPEQAEGMVAQLDQRSDIYSLGGILYAILTLRPPIEGKTLDEVLTKVKNGSISAMVTKRGGKGRVAHGEPAAMGVEVPEALQSVTLRAMATARQNRYASVEEFAADLERYQNGFATQAEDAGALRQFILFIKRNRAVSSVAAVFVTAAIGFTLKLVASERIARAHETQARLEMEKARRAEAEARMAVAEAAEANADPETLDRELAKVPEDLRTSDWEYLHERIETAKFTIHAGEGQAWTGFEDLPSDPDRMIALRADGQVFAVNVKSGESEPLWSFNPQAAQSRSTIGVSEDGTLMALGYRKGSALHAEVRNARDGSPVGTISLGQGSCYTLLISAEVCVRRSSNFIDGWDYKTGQRLWQTPGQFVEWSTDRKHLFILNLEGAVEKRESVSGNLVSKGALACGSFHDWIPHNGMGAPDWQKCFLPRGLSHALRAVNPWSGQVIYEVVPTHGNHGSGMIPPGKLFATVGASSRNGAVLELRVAASGSLSRALPTLASVLGQGAAPRICAKPSAVAVNFRESLKIWHLDLLAPTFDLTRGGMDGVRVGNSNLVVTADKSNLVMFDGVQGDRQKSKVSQAPCPFNPYGVIISPNGERLLAYAYGQAAAYRVGKNGLEQLWPKSQSYRALEGYPLSFHPNEDRLWTGSRIFEFSSGREVAAVNREGLNFGTVPAWIGSDRVAEIAQAENRQSEPGQSSGEPFQIALWDATLGKLVTKVSAEHAEWIATSSDHLHLAEAGADKRVRIRSSLTLEIEREFRAHETALMGVIWHPTLPLLVTLGRDGLFRIWNTSGFQKIEEFQSEPAFSPQHKKFVYISITPDGRELNLHRMGKISVFRPRSFGG